jgi:hypothetical protein
MICSMPLSIVGSTAAAPARIQVGTPPSVRAVRALLVTRSREYPCSPSGSSRIDARGLRAPCWQNWVQGARSSARPLTSARARTRTVSADSVSRPSDLRAWRVANSRCGKAERDLVRHETDRGQGASRHTTRLKRACHRRPAQICLSGVGSARGRARAQQRIA